MKKLLLILLFTIGVFAANAQHDNHRERIKALKTVHITEALNLSSKEAEKFWPIYNEYDKKIHKLRVQSRRDFRRKIKKSGGLENLSDAEFKKMLATMIENDFEEAKAKQKLVKDLSKVISDKKIVTLFIQEHNFNKKLLKRFRGKNR